MHIAALENKVSGNLVPRDISYSSPGASLWLQGTVTSMKSHLMGRTSLKLFAIVKIHRITSTAGNLLTKNWPLEPIGSIGLTSIAG